MRQRQIGTDGPWVGEIGLGCMGMSFAYGPRDDAGSAETLLRALDLGVTHFDTADMYGFGHNEELVGRVLGGLWSNYAGAGPFIRFIRVGTLDDPDQLPPDIHIFTASKQPWVILPPNTPSVPEYYDRTQYWPAESLQRREALLQKIAAAGGPRA